MRPLTVQIDPPMNGHLTAGIKSQVVCHSVGARPPAKFHWFIGDPQRDLTDSGFV